MRGAKGVLEGERECCRAVLASVERGAATVEQVDVSRLESLATDCELGLVELEEYEGQHVARIRNAFVELHFFCREANEISEELEKFLSFELCLVSRGGPGGVAEASDGGGTDGDDDGGDDGDGDGDGDGGEEKKETATATEEHQKGSEEHQKGSMEAYAELIAKGLDVDDLELSQYQAFPAEFWIKVKHTGGEKPEELWHQLKFKNRLSLMRDMWATYVRCNRDLLALSKARPPAVDPFYEPPTDSLIGVAYCFLDALSYMVEIHESITIINFKGQLVGELEVSLSVVMENNAGIEKEEGGDGEVDFTSEEFTIGDHVGESMQITVTIKTAKGVPRRQCSGVFVSFPFFLNTQPFSTTRCNKATVNPWFNETFSVKQVITEDFIDYLSHNAVEIELWGAPESLVKEGQGDAKEATPVGEEIEADVLEEGAAAAHEDEEGGEQDVGHLHDRVEDLEHELKVAKDVAKKDHSNLEEEMTAMDRGLKAEEKKNYDLSMRYETFKQESEAKIAELEEEKRTLKKQSGVCAVS